MNHGDYREDRRRYVGEVRRVLHGRLGVSVPLDDDALGLIVIEVGVVLSVPVSLVVFTISMAWADERLYSSSLPSWNLNRAIPRSSLIARAS